MNDALATRIGPLELRNPVLCASGTYGSGVEVAGFVDLARVGGVVTKSVTTKPRRGNRPPRIVETASGMLNSIGLMNPGVDRFVAEVMPDFRDLPCARIVNVAGESAADFEDLARRFDAEPGVDAIELNVSCPNVAGGLDYGADAGLLEQVVARCRAATGRPLIAKLTPNVTDVVAMARAARRGGADAVSLVNTYRGLAIDWRRRRPLLGSPSGGGGLSGPAIKPMALWAVHAVASAIPDLPIVGIGGVMGADDVLEFVVAGAAAVQVGTASFVDPRRAVTIVEDLEGLVARGEVTGIASMIGTVGRQRDRG